MKIKSFLMACLATVGVSLSFLAPVTTASAVESYVHDLSASAAALISTDIALVAGPLGALDSPLDAVSSSPDLEPFDIAMFLALMPGGEGDDGGDDDDGDKPESIVPYLDFRSTFLRI